MVCAISARSASIGGVAANHSWLSDPLNCLAICFDISCLCQCQPILLSGAPCLSSPSIEQEALYRTRAFCRNTPSQAVWLPCNHPVLDRATHHGTLFSRSLKFACGCFTSTLARRYLCCLLHLCCNRIPQEISSCKSSMLLCSFPSRCSEYLLFRRRTFAETRKVKAIAGQVVTITVGFSFDGRLQPPRLTDVSLAHVIS